MFGHLTLKSLPPTMMKNALLHYTSTTGVCLRPADMLKDDKFYIQANNSSNKTGIWFKKQIVGINKISGIMPKMIKEAGITSDRRLTNTSARKHLLTKLADHNIPDRQIVQISGHKNISSINHYAHMSRKRQSEISDIMSGNNNSNNSAKSLCTSKSNTEFSTQPSTCNISTTSRTVPAYFSFLNNCTINGAITITMLSDGQTATKILKSDEVVMSQIQN